MKDEDQEYLFLPNSFRDSLNILICTYAPQMPSVKCCSCATQPHLYEEVSLVLQLCATDHLNLCCCTMYTVHYK